MIRKLVISAATLTLGLSVFAAGSAQAGAPKVDVSQDTITCNTVNGTAGIKPSLINGGSATATLITVKGILNGCTVSGPNAATVLSGSFTGKLTGSSNDCSTLLGPVPIGGTLTVKWKADATTPLLQTSTIVSPTTLTGGLFTTDPWGGAYGQFGLSGGGATGAFAGTDAGASSNTTAITSEDIGAILAGCGAAGIKSFHLGLGQLNLG